MRMQIDLFWPVNILIGVRLIMRLHHTSRIVWERRNPTESVHVYSLFAFLPLIALRTNECKWTCNHISHIYHRSPFRDVAMPTELYLVGNIWLNAASLRNQNDLWPCFAQLQRCFKVKHTRARHLVTNKLVLWPADIVTLQKMSILGFDHYVEGWYQYFYFST